MAASHGQIVLAFDLYGTLLSTDSIVKELAQHFGQEKAKTIATVWRRYQLEYTWRHNSLNTYVPFSDVTLSALKHALADSSVSLDQSAIASMIKAYDSLSTFPDATPALKALASEPDIIPVVFSNGTQSMVSNSVHHSPGLAPFSNVLKRIVVVEEARRYKPAPEVYRLLADQMGKSVEQMGDMWLVSGNPFDVVGARHVGMKAAWIDRAGNGWTDQQIQGENGRPSVIVSELGQVIEAVKKHAK